MATELHTQAASVACAAELWPTIDALMGGTPAMRKAGTSLLPKWPAEEQDHYQARLKSATLFPAFRRTVEVMASKPFSKAPTPSEEVPAEFVEYMDDIDLQGHNLQAFAAPIMREVMAYGFAGVLVDFPKSNAKTKADEQKINARPYWVWIKHDQVLGWRSARVNGANRLTLLRLSETAEIDDGDYGSATVERVRVLRPGSWELWQKGTKGGYTLFDEGATTLDEIPYVPFVAQRDQYMIGSPPMLDLAYLNVKHWQSQSDQDTILHVARVPILFAKGFGDESQIVIGSSSAVKTDSTNADMKFVEHGGAAISAGKESLLALEDQMIQTGAELLVQQAGSRTATEDANDAEANKSQLQQIVEGFEDSLDFCLYFTAKWIGAETGGRVSLFKDFSANSLAAASADLLKLQQGGIITKKTLIAEQQRRGVLSPDIDPEAELQAVDEEAPALGMIGEPIEEPANADG